MNRLTEEQKDHVLAVARAIEERNELYDQSRFLHYGGEIGGEPCGTPSCLAGFSCAVHLGHDSQWRMVFGVGEMSRMVTEDKDGNAITIAEVVGKDVRINSNHLCRVAAKCMGFPDIERPNTLPAFLGVPEDFQADSGLDGYTTMERNPHWKETVESLRQYAETGQWDWVRLMEYLSLIHI